MMYNQYIFSTQVCRANHPLLSLILAVPGPAFLEYLVYLVVPGVPVGTSCAWPHLPSLSYLNVPEDTPYWGKKAPLLQLHHYHTHS